jgi:hypothetical protein
VKTGRGNPVDTTLVPPLLQIKVFYHVMRNVDRLDDRTAHIQNIQCTIGRIHEIDWAKSIVGRADELGDLFLRATNRLKSQPVGHQDSSMDQVILGITDKNILVILRRIRAATVDYNPGTGVDNIVACTCGFGRTCSMGNPTA